MVFGSSPIVFSVGIALFHLGLILAVGDYSTSECQGTATKCDIVTPAEAQRIKEALSEGGCTVNNTPAERKQFALCTQSFNPQLYKNISELANNDTQCKNEIDFKFQEQGLLAECEIFGTPLADCYTRCATCLRLEAFGFDSTKLALQSFEACNMNKTSSNGTYS